MVILVPLAKLFERNILLTDEIATPFLTVRLTYNSMVSVVFGINTMRGYWYLMKQNSASPLQQVPLVLSQIPQKTMTL